MVKHFGTLASRVLRAHQEVTPCLMRIQSGFMADKNIETVEKTLQEMQETLRLMREALKAPKQYISDAYVPLK
jgi:hypothetical protein